MKRKHHEIVGSSDQPNVKRIRKVLPYLAGELVRRISEFVVELTHTRFVRTFPMLSQLRHPLRYDIQLTNQAIHFNPFAHLPGPNVFPRTLRFTRFDPRQRYVIFQTLENAGYQLVRVPLHFIRSLTQIDR